MCVCVCVYEWQSRWLGIVGVGTDEGWGEGVTDGGLYTSAQKKKVNGRHLWHARKEKKRERKY